ncbi:hypothetical protein [Opitutus sp. ER46]|uniref:hypothetical protein n=1 Tax=Opitutus sp. ER46 TaxID=2161864 RepID=UPI000D30AE0F|nr:hypothetical protein [Opitutus sp. ER46]PTX97671.1 hypothetical protein DB354_05140 [Opitutus sp. ER46]
MEAPHDSTSGTFSLNVSYPKYLLVIHRKINGVNFDTYLGSDGIDTFTTTEQETTTSPIGQKIARGRVVPGIVPSHLERSTATPQLIWLTFLPRVMPDEKAASVVTSFLPTELFVREPSVPSKAFHVDVQRNAQGETSQIDYVAPGYIFASRPTPDELRARGLPANATVVSREGVDPSTIPPGKYAANLARPYDKGYVAAQFQALPTKDYGTVKLPSGARLLEFATMPGAKTKSELRVLVTYAVNVTEGTADTGPVTTGLPPLTPGARIDDYRLLDSSGKQVTYISPHGEWLLRQSERFQTAERMARPEALLGEM